MDDFFAQREGSGGTYSNLFAEIANIEKLENFEYLIIVTDGQVSQKEIKKCNDLVKIYYLIWLMVE